MKRVSCQSLFASVPRGCANYLSFLLQMPGSPNFVGRVASLSPRLPPNMVSQHGDRLAWVLSSASLGPMVLLSGDPSVSVPCDVSFGRAVTDSHECELLNAIARLRPSRPWVIWYGKKWNLFCLNQMLP